MRLGGTQEATESPRFGRWVARFVVGLAALVAVPLPAGASAEPAGEPVETFAVVRTAEGLEVVEGEAVSEEAAKAELGDKVEGTVLTVEVDTPVSVLGATDPQRSNQWALDLTSFEQAWSTTTGNRTIVAVIDTGVRGDHEDLAGAVLPGLDLVGNSDGRIDPNGHGTHVAGIIAARASNGVGVAGAAPTVRILPVRVLDANGAGSSSAVTQGIIWAVDQGARVINLSLGGTTPSEGMRQAIQYANSKRVVVLAAAGNSGLQGSPTVYPAAFPESIAVGAVNSNLQRAAFSNVGSYVDLAAPGDGILSTYGTSKTAYAYASGTSMATPYAAAAAALVIAADTSLSATAVRNRLESTARDLGPPGADAEYGKGLVNPAAATRRRATSPSSGPAKDGSGYWVVTTDGRVKAFGGARHRGDLAGRPLSAPIVASAPTATGKGYWLAGADGAVYSFGDARFHGSMAGRALNAPIVGMAVTPDGGGYFLLGGDGGIFTFGNAKFKGSTGAMRLNAPVLDMATTSTGNGYWLAAADGGIFTFGDAKFKGSTGGMQLASPAASMTTAADGKGYWVVARDGGLFAFGVPFHGSLPGLGIPGLPAGQRIRALPDGKGYYILGVDGGVFAFGTAKSFGSASGLSASASAVDLMLVP